MNQRNSKGIKCNIKNEPKNLLQKEHGFIP